MLHIAARKPHRKAQVCETDASTHENKPAKHTPLATPPKSLLQHHQREKSLSTAHHAHSPHVSLMSLHPQVQRPPRPPSPPSQVPAREHSLHFTQTLANH